MWLEANLMHVMFIQSSSSFPPLRSLVLVYFYRFLMYLTIRLIWSSQLNRVKQSVSYRMNHVLSNQYFMESPMWGWKTDLYKQQCTLAHSTAEANSKAETEKMSVSYMATSPLSANSPNPFWRTKVQRPVCRFGKQAAYTSCKQLENNEESHVMIGGMLSLV